MANELLGARACLLDFCKLLQPIAPIVAISAKPTLATLNILLTLENTGQTKTSKTLVQIENLLDQHDQEVMYFFKMYSVFSVNFSRSGESSESCRHLTRGASKSVSWRHIFDTMIVQKKGHNRLKVEPAKNKHKRELLGYYAAKAKWLVQGHYGSEVT